jgi:hypothetical protein
MFCMSTWQPHLPALAASSIESLTCLGQSFVQVSNRAKSSPWLAQVAARCRIHICVQAANSCAAEFASACRLPMSPLPNSSTTPVLVCLCPWQIFLSGLDISSSSQCSSTIYAADFPLTNLQPHKSTLPISPTVGIAANTLRPCFGQPAEACIPCTFDTVTGFP